MSRTIAAEGGGFALALEDVVRASHGPKSVSSDPFLDPFEYCFRFDAAAEWFVHMR